MKLFSVNREFMGFLFIIALSIADTFLIAHPSLIIQAGYFFPELTFLTKLSTSMFLVIGMMSLFYIISGIIVQNAAVKPHLIPSAFRWIYILLATVTLLLLLSLPIFMFSAYRMLYLPFKVGVFLFLLVLLFIVLFRISSLRKIKKWHEAE